MTSNTRVRLPLDYFRAHRQASKAIQRGDLAGANKWMETIERLLKIAEREQALIHAHAQVKAGR